MRVWFFSLNCIGAACSCKLTPIHSLLILRCYYHFNLTCNGDTLTRFPSPIQPLKEHRDDIPFQQKSSHRPTSTTILQTSHLSQGETKLRERVSVSWHGSKSVLSIKIWASRELVFGLMTNSHLTLPLLFISLYVCPWKLTKTIADTQSMSSPRNYSSC